MCACPGSASWRGSKHPHTVPEPNFVRGGGLRATQPTSGMAANSDLHTTAYNTNKQIQFWKNRQSEVEGYAMQYKPLTFRAGDLTDPLYFDFISYSQYATISK